MKRRLCLAIAVSIGTAQAQSPQPRPEFEVATIKLNTGCGMGRGGGRGPSPGRLNVGCVALRDLIQMAYGAFANGPALNPKRLQVLDAPGWVESDRYDIDAKAESAAPLDRMAGPMLQALLEDRFKLKIHRETRELPVYTLTVAKSGFKVQPLKERSCIAIDLNHLPAPPAPGQPMPNFCGRQTFTTKEGVLTLDAHGETVAQLMYGILSTRLDRPVLDKTGITGMYDFHLEFAPDPDMPAPSPETAGPSIFTAVQEQLGLKLSPDKGPVEVLVVDHVEKPSEN